MQTNYIKKAKRLWKSSKENSKWYIIVRNYCMMFTRKTSKDWLKRQISIFHETLLSFFASQRSWHEKHSCHFFKSSGRRKVKQHFTTKAHILEGGDESVGIQGWGISGIKINGTGRQVWEIFVGGCVWGLMIPITTASFQTPVSPPILICVLTPPHVNLAHKSWETVDDWVCFWSSSSAPRSGERDVAIWCAWDLYNSQNQVNYS